MDSSNYTEVATIREIGSPYLLPQLSYFRICSSQERCAYMWRSSEAKHCSSLCLQSEGDECCGGQAWAKNPIKSWAEALPCSLRVRGPHFASKVSYNAGASPNLGFLDFERPTCHCSEYNQNTYSANIHDLPYTYKKERPRGPLFLYVNQWLSSGFLGLSSFTRIHFSCASRVCPGIL